MNDWIRVEDRLPDAGEIVWAVYKNSLFPNGKSYHKTLKYDGKMWTDENGYRYMTVNITHWKHKDPLPEQGKTEEKRFTNADRFNEMTVEEKAAFFVKLLSEIFEMVKKAFHIPTESVELDKNTLKQEWLEWLDQEDEVEFDKNPLLQELLNPRGGA